MAKVGAFSVPDCHRIVRAVHAVEGGPRTYVHVPQRVPNNSGVGSTGGGGGSSSGTAWTIAEYDPISGARIRTFDRGRGRSTVSVGDAFMLIGSDGYLYAAGTGHINELTGAVIKWDIDTGEQVWASDSGSLDITEVGALDTASAVGSLLVEASDGFIWYTGGVFGSDSYLCRFDPTTGEQTHASSSAVRIHSLFVADSDGGVGTIYQSTSGTTIRVYDDTVTQTASYVGAVQDAMVHDGLIYAAELTTDTIFILNADDLTSVDSRTLTASNPISITSDGTTVWVCCDEVSDTIRAYDATNLAAAEVFNVSKDAAEIREMIYDNGELFIFGNGTRSMNPTTGAELWEHTGAYQLRRPGNVGVGSDYLAISTNVGSALGNVFCLERSSGDVRWHEQWNGGGCIVGPDDRLFICGARIGP